MSRSVVVVAVAPLAQAAYNGFKDGNATRNAERQKNWATLVSSTNMYSGPMKAGCEMDMRDSMPACHQEGDMWCWATGVTSLKAYYKGGDCSAECTIVGWCHEPKDTSDFDSGCTSEKIECCPFSKHSECGDDGSNNGMLLEAARHFTGHTHDMYGGPMEQTVLDETLGKGIPILMLVGPKNDGPCHVVSVAGCGSGSYFFHDPETKEGKYEKRDYKKLLQWKEESGDKWVWYDTVYAISADKDDEDDEDEDDDEPTMTPETTMAPETTIAPETSMAPETTMPPAPPATTVAPDPSLTLKQCHACFTMCAPCQACAEGANATSAYGSCDKCWQCWNFEKDELKDDEKHMDKDCDVMHHSHDWDSHKVRCLTDFPKSSKVTHDCRPCWATFPDGPLGPVGMEGMMGDMLLV